MSYSTSSLVSFTLKERLQNMKTFARDAIRFRPEDAINMAEDIAELVYGDMGLHPSNPTFMEIELEKVYNEIYHSLLENIGIGTFERMNLVLQRLHVLLFGGTQSPLLPLEILAQKANTTPYAVRAQANTLLRILVGRPDRIVSLDMNGKVIEASWFYPQAFNEMYLGGQELYTETKSSLDQAGFSIHQHLSPVNYKMYYEIALKCNRTDLPMKRQLENPLIYEKETSGQLVETMF